MLQLERVTYSYSLTVTIFCFEIWRIIIAIEIKQQQQQQQQKENVSPRSFTVIVVDVSSAVECNNKSYCILSDNDL